MPQEKLPKKLYLPKQMEKKQLDDLKLLKMNQYYIEDLMWNCLRLHPSETMSVMELREVWKLNLELLPPQPFGKEGNEERFFLEVFNGFVCFSTVCSVKVTFVQTFHFTYQLLYFLNYFYLTNCKNSSFVVGKHVLLIV